MLRVATTGVKERYHVLVTANVTQNMS